MSTRLPFFTSDLHFFHNNIIKYCNRPFANADEMNEGLISGWNETVSPEDHTYILGDVSFGGRDATLHVLSRLNGTKTLIEGNHDEMDLGPAFEETWQYMNRRIEGREIIMFHFPIESWHHRMAGSIHLHGHIHSSNFKDPKALNRFDVGVDANQYAPVNLKEILKHAVSREEVRAAAGM